MATKKRITADRIINLYMDYYLEHGEAPKSVYHFAKVNKFDARTHRIIFFFSPPLQTPKRSRLEFHRRPKMWEWAFLYNPVATKARDGELIVWDCSRKIGYLHAFMVNKRKQKVC